MRIREEVLGWTFSRPVFSPSRSFSNSFALPVPSHQSVSDGGNGKSWTNEEEDSQQQSNDHRSRHDRRPCSTRSDVGCLREWGESIVLPYLVRYLGIVLFILLLLCYFSVVNVPFSVISFLLRSQNIPLKQKSCHLQNDLLMTTLSVCRTNWVSVVPQQGAKQEVVKLTKDTLPIPPIDTQNYEIKDHLTPKSFHQIIPHALRSFIPLKCPEMLIPQIKYSVWLTLSPLVTVERLPEMIVVACLLYCLWSEWQWTSTAWIYR